MENENYRKFVHAKLLELIKFIDDVCKRESITYSLIGGTMLGAVRHNGFIPWDDDADVVMTRAEFNKFKQVAKKYLEGSVYAWRRLSRVEGVVFKEPQKFDDGGTIDHLMVDIFVLDNVPDSERAYKRHIFKLKKLQGMLKKGKINWKKYSFKGKVLIFGTRLLGAFYSKEKLLNKYEKMSAKFNGSSTKRMIVSNDLYETFHIPYDKELLSETVPHVFETETFPIFKHYDEILTALYGDYMTPPPESERVFMHTEHND